MELMREMALQSQNKSAAERKDNPSAKKFSSVLEREQFSAFFAAIADDPRINTTHISLYMALLQYWKEHSFMNPIQVYSHEIMPMAKILSSATFHRSIRDLHDFGYIKYEPSYKRNQGSKIYMLIKSS